MTETTPKGQHRVAELASAFRVMPTRWEDHDVESLGRLGVDADELQLMRDWDRMTSTVVQSKFDCCVSSAFDAASFDGLNRSVTDRYLTDDPAHSFELPTSVDGRWDHYADRSWAGGYHFFDYADFEGLVLDEEELYADEDFRQEVISRRRQSLFAPSAPRRAQLDAQATDARRSRRDDPSFVSAYPRAMGSAGTTLLTRPQRSMARLTRPQHRRAASEVARRLTHHERVSGPTAGSLTAGAPSWAPITLDASVADSLPLLAGAPLDDAAAPATVSGGGQALLDGLAIERRQMPALTGALDVARIAFGGEAAPAPGRRTAPPRDRIGGVFSAARAQRALRMVSLDGSAPAVSTVSALPEQVPGYPNLIYDAAEHTWVLPEGEAPARFDAADVTTSPARRGRMMSPSAAAPRLIARALPAAASPSLAARAAAGAGAPGGDARPLVSRAASQQQTGVAAGQLSPVVAPVVELAGQAPAGIEAAVRRTLPPIGQRVTRDRAAGALPRTGATGIALSAMVPAAARAEAQARRRASAAALRQQREAGAVAPLGLAMGAGPLGATTTGPELFAAQRMETSRPGLASLLRAGESPVTVAGETRYGYGSFAGAIDDPVVYLDLADASAGGRRLSAVADAGLRATSMPLSSAARLQAALAASPARFDAAAPEAAIAPAGRTGRTASAAVRGADGIVLRRALTPGAEAFAETARTPNLGTPEPMVPGLAAAAFDTGDPLFYHFAYDPEQTWLETAPEALYGGHVEVRDGHLVRAVPATAAAARAATARGATAARRPVGVLGAGLKTEATTAQLQQRAAALRQGGIVPAATTAVVSGASRIERGFPALSLSAPEAERLDAPLVSQSQASVLATASEAELALLPPMARAMFGPNARRAEAMTAAGTDAAGLLGRLQALADPSAPGSRSAILRELATLGVDTPELLKVLDEPMAAGHLPALDARDTSRVERATAGPAGEVVTTEALQRAERVSDQLRRIVGRMTGVPDAARAETSVSQDSYWGAFAPAKLLRADASDLLRTLLTTRTGDEATRPSALAYGAEMGELLAVGRPELGGMGSASIAAATATGRRIAASGAPSRAARFGTRDGRIELRRQRHERAVAERAEQMAERMSARATPDAAGRLDAPAGPADLVDRVGDAVAGSLRGGPATTTVAGLSDLGWDTDELTLTALEESTSRSLADRVTASVAPWQAGAPARDGGPSPTSPMARAADQPLARALQERRGDTLPSATSPLAAGGMDLGPIGELLRRGGDGLRGFSSLGSEQARRLLTALPSRRALTSSLAGGLDLAYAVIERANGSFADLDAGVWEFLSRTAGRSHAAPPGAHDEAQPGMDLRPGVDEWPAETLEILQAAGWGKSADNRPARRAGPEQMATQEARVQRLERRVGAARDAYAKLEESRHRTGTSAQATDSLDWSLVNTGARRETPAGADLGRLAHTMVRSASVPATEMSYVAPAVKVVAQQAQLHGRDEAAPSSSGAKQRPATPGQKPKQKAQKPDIEGLARQIHRRLQRRWALERERVGKF